MKPISQNPTEEVIRNYKKKNLTAKATINRVDGTKFDFVIDLGEGEVTLTTKRQVKDAMKDLRKKLGALRHDRKLGSTGAKMIQVRYSLLKVALTEHTRKEAYGLMPSLRSIRAAVAYHSTELARARKLLAERKLQKDGIQLGVFHRMVWKLDREFSGGFSIVSPRLNAFPNLPQEIGKVQLQAEIYLSTRSGDLVIHSKSLTSLLKFIKAHDLKCTTAELEKKAQNYTRMMTDINLALTTVKA